MPSAAGSLYPGASAHFDHDFTQTSYDDADELLSGDDTAQLALADMDEFLVGDAFSASPNGSTIGDNDDVFVDTDSFLSTMPTAPAKGRKSNAKRTRSSRTAKPTTVAIDDDDGDEDYAPSQETSSFETATTNQDTAVPVAAPDAKVLEQQLAPPTKKRRGRKPKAVVGGVSALARIALGATQSVPDAVNPADDIVPAFDTVFNTPILSLVNCLVQFCTTAISALASKNSERRFRKACAVSSYDRYLSQRQFNAMDYASNKIVSLITSMSTISILASSVSALAANSMENVAARMVAADPAPTVSALLDSCVQQGQTMFFSVLSVALFVLDFCATHHPSVLVDEALPAADNHHAPPVMCNDLDARYDQLVQIASNPKCDDRSEYDGSWFRSASLEQIRACQSLVQAVFSELLCQVPQNEKSHCLAMYSAPHLVAVVHESMVTRLASYFVSVQNAPQMSKVLYSGKFRSPLMDAARVNAIETVAGEMRLSSDVPTAIGSVDARFAKFLSAEDLELLPVVKRVLPDTAHRYLEYLAFGAPVCVLLEAFDVLHSRCMGTTNQRVQALGVAKVLKAFDPEVAAFEHSANTCIAIAHDHVKQAFDIVESTRPTGTNCMPFALVAEEPLDAESIGEYHVGRNRMAPTLLYF